MKSYLTKKMLKNKHFQRFTYPKDMDVELIDLMDILNNIPGCQTKYCCCGHGKDGWYFVMSSFNFHIIEIIQGIFKTIPGSEFSIGGTCECLIDRLAEQTYYPEMISLSVYCNSLGKLPSMKRYLEYRRISGLLLDLVPGRWW